MKHGLTAASLETLLRALDSEVERAGRRYEELRTRIIRYFTWERCPHPEELADKAFNRMARRLAEGERIESPDAYLAGVARFLERESQQRKAREKSAFEEWRRRKRLTAREETGWSSSRLENCLQNLSPDQRDLLVNYYEGDGAARIAARDKMAAEMNLQPNALRNRALRLRQKLERCMRDISRKAST